ncbi:MAG: nucleotidyltransferase family protein [Myxococcota bacterium]
MVRSVLRTCGAALHLARGRDAPLAHDDDGRGSRAGLRHRARPFGLADLFARRFRPNRVLASGATYRRKTQRWKALWPEIEVESW